MARRLLSGVQLVLLLVLLGLAFVLLPRRRAAAAMLAPERQHAAAPAARAAERVLAGRPHAGLRSATVGDLAGEIFFVELSGGAARPPPLGAAGVCAIESACRAYPRAKIVLVTADGLREDDGAELSILNVDGACRGRITNAGWRQYVETWERDVAEAGIDIDALIDTEKDAGAAVDAGRARAERADVEAVCARSRSGSNDDDDVLHAAHKAPAVAHMLAWYKRGAWRKGYVLNNLSNAIRLILLARHGGRYYDLDVLHVRGVPATVHNVVALEDANKLNTAALAFDAGHPFLLNVTHNFATYFNGTVWSYNGPRVVTWTYNRLCGTANPTRADCAGVSILAAESYYGVHYRKIRDIYTVQNATLDLLSNSNIFGVHLWNAFHPADWPPDIYPEAGSPLHRLLQHACPYTLANTGLNAFVRVKRRHWDQAVPSALALASTIA